MWRRIVLMAVPLWSVGFVGAAIAFSDTPGHWASACIDQLQAQGKIAGYPDGTFRPNGPVNRAEYAAVMLAAFPTVDHWLTAPTAPEALRNPGFAYWYEDPQRPEADRNSPYSWNPQPVDFVDIRPDFWGYEATRRAAGRRMFVGYPDGTFRPNQLIPRVQAVAVMAKEMRYAEPSNPETILTRYFDDAAEIPSYARAAIATATVGRLAVNGPNVRQFRPNQNTTRGEVAALLCQAMGLARTLPLNYIAAGDQFAIPPEAGGRRPFSEGLAVAEVNSQLGYIDTEGNLAIPARYDQAGDFKDGFAQVVQNGRPGFINRAGALVTPPVGYEPASEDLILSEPSDGLFFRAHNARSVGFIVGFDGGQIPQYSVMDVGGIWGYFSATP